MKFLGGAMQWKEDFSLFGFDFNTFLQYQNFLQLEFRGRNMGIRCVVRWLVCCCLMAGLYSADSTYIPKEEPAAKVSLVFPEKIPAGREILGVLEFDIPEGWHIYWKNPGEVGLAPTFQWKLPEGVSISNIDWPSPTRFDHGSTSFYGYEGKPQWIVHLKTDQNFRGKLPVQASVFWLGCNDVCVPFSQDVEVVAEVGDTGLITASGVEEANHNIPSFLDGTQAFFESGVLKLKVPGSYEGLKDVVFFPELQGLFSPGALMKWAKTETGIEISIQCYEAAKDLTKKEIVGLVQLIFSDKKTTFAIQAPVTIVMPKVVQPVVQSLQMPSVSTSLQTNGLSFVLFLAFLGGVLLNATPCVLPVIGLKVLHLFSFREQKRGLALHGISFLLGVLAMFGLLGGGLYFLEYLGVVAGWGFQLQNPLFVVSLAIAMFVFSLSLFDVIEIGASLSSWSSSVEGQLRASTGPSYLASFVSGLFVTLVATPCTGPFLGSVLGFAMAFSPRDGAMIFGAIGVGMAFPFVLLTLFPGLISKLPKPGAWMVTLKQFFGFCALATVVWLVWVLGAEAQNLSFPMLFSGFFSVALGVWILGRFGNITRGFLCRLFGKTIAFIVLFFGVALALISFDSPIIDFVKKHVSFKEKIQWQPYSQHKVEEEVASGKIVFVKFSARWCLVCQTNALSFYSPEVAKTFAKYKVVALDADWTNGDPQITHMLRMLGRNGVPTNAIFKKGKDPVLLPEIITPETIINAVKTVAGEQQTNV